MNKLSSLASTLIPSEIIKLGNDLNERIRAGKQIYNFTIGDFDPSIFPIPEALEQAIIEAYQQHKTNYPPATGILALREAVSQYIQSQLNIEYHADQFLISGGGRPLIYAAYRVICDEDEKIIYPVPSWNNNHYSHFVKGNHCIIDTTPENNFMPKAEDIIPHLQDAALVSLCSPLNPTGTVFKKEELAKICEAILNENKRRGSDRKPIYLIYDQIYWTLLFNNEEHIHPVGLYPEMKDYTIYVDGISKAFCATGVRVGWAFGPSIVIDKMRAILSHVGAWSPMAEQVGTAQFLSKLPAVAQATSKIREAIHLRLQMLYAGFVQLREKGYPVDVLIPQGAMYLTVKLDLKGKKIDGKPLIDNYEIINFLIDHASLGIVPFSAFGAGQHSEWYRISVGTCHVELIDDMFVKLESALASLS
ncbi:MAG: aminotransferase class I/II-fold pyridoxal phosphate-dependent enzyme [Chitinophagaceae bacterium]